MTLPALQTAPLAREDAPPRVPVHLDHYRRRWPAYLACPADRDIIGAVLASTAWRRRTWPCNETARAWCEAEDPSLLAYLVDVGARDAWHEVHEVRRQSGGLYAPAWLPFSSDRRLGAEKIASFAAAVPRMRALGAILLAEDADGPGLDLGLDHAAGDGSEGSGGGRKAKPRKAPDIEEDEPDGLALRADEIEDLGLDTPRPPWA